MVFFSQALSMLLVIFRSLLYHLPTPEDTITYRKNLSQIGIKHFRVLDLKFFYTL